MKKVYFIYFALLLTGVIQGIYYQPHMPEIMASRFDASGTPVSSMSKDRYVGLAIGSILFLTGMFLSFPLFIHKTPNRLINLPNKDYWLSPERRQNTLIYFLDKLDIMGIITIVFMLIAFELGYRANLVNPVHFKSGIMWTCFAIFMICIIIWTYRFCMHFTKIPSTQ